MSLSDASTTIPGLTIGTAGIVAPAELDILSGRLSDLTAAFGGALNQDLSTPQGQMATTEAAVIGSLLDFMAGVYSNFDPLVASGRAQDAIGNIYFLTRNGASATTVQATIAGAAGQSIPSGTIIATDGEYQYALTADAQIGSDGTVTIMLVNTQSGALPCAANALSLYQYVSGVSSVSNATEGVIGQDVEGRIAFEQRRNDTVAANSIGQAGSVLGAILKLDGVTDAYVYDNGQSQDVVYNGVTVSKNSLYVCVAGGSPQDIGLAIIQKKGPGCGYTGGTTVWVRDPAPAYGGNGPGYPVSYDVAQPVGIYFSVTLANGSDIPSTALSDIQAAIVAQFATGGSSGRRPRIASRIFASSFICAVSALGSWVRVLEIKIGTSAPADQDAVTMTMAQVPTIAAGNISITLE